MAEKSFLAILIILWIIGYFTGIPSLRAERSNPGDSLQFVRQVSPRRIHDFNESQLLLPRTALDLFLTRNGGMHCVVYFVIHQIMHMVLFRKSVHHSRSMFLQTFLQMRCYACIQGAIAPARKNIHARNHVPHYATILWIASLRSQRRGIFYTSVTSEISYDPILSYET